ncbi:AAA family ATPase [Streptomyces sp. NPDC050504]|uniref:AAA family ATPase n=1 Tax=Streptomyces sp. NPDC050504 TaxID=3365618 RepID=UPI00379845B9
MTDERGPEHSGPRTRGGIHDGTDRQGHGTDQRAHGTVHNTITDGVVHGPVIQAGDITVRLPRPSPTALSGLPPACGTFTGRDAEVAALLSALAPGAPHRPVLVSAVAGLGGIGKTELAVQTATRALRQDGWFPGGVLYVDMLGYDPEHPLAPEQALDRLLRALGTHHEDVPPDLQGRSLLFRSVLSALAADGRRVLLVIDNASDEGQVRPLLPTDGATATLVTSRDTLDVGARLYDLDGLAEDAAVDLLDRALREARGPDDTRVSDAPGDAAAVARLCAGLPLALRITAALLADSPARPLASLAGALAAEHSRLDRLSRRDRTVRAAFDLSYRRLGADHARLFRLLPLNPGPDVSTEAAARLADVTAPEAETLLQDLARTHLVEPGPVWGRWRLHDLVHLYAVEQGRALDEGSHRRAALARLHQYYGAVSRDARTVMIGATRPPPRPVSARFAHARLAEEWFAAERLNLINTITAAPPLGNPAVSAVLAALLADYLSWEHLLDDLHTVTGTVRGLADSGRITPGLAARALFHLGHGHRRAGRLNGAVHTLLAAVPLAREADNLRLHRRILYEIRHTLHKLAAPPWKNAFAPAARGAVEEFVAAHPPDPAVTHTDETFPWECGCPACWRKLLAKAGSGDA